jgi:hypothetical protein
VYRSHLETESPAPGREPRGCAAPVNGVWKIAKRTVLLDANVLLDKNLSIFLYVR